MRRNRSLLPYHCDVERRAQCWEEWQECCLNSSPNSRPRDGLFCHTRRDYHRKPRHLLLVVSQHDLPVREPSSSSEPKKRVEFYRRNAAETLRYHVRRTFTAICHRPFRRLRASVARPPEEARRFRKPCVRARFRRFIAVSRIE